MGDWNKDLYQIMRTQKIRSMPTFQCVAREAAHRLFFAAPAHLLAFFPLPLAFSHAPGKPVASSRTQAVEKWGAGRHCERL